MTHSLRRDADLLQQALDGAPTNRADLTALASLAGSLPRSRSAPDPAFVARLRAELVTAQPPTQLAPGDATHAVLRPPARYALTALVAAAALLALVAGPLSTSALPGDRLYRVKLAIGAAHVRLAGDDTSRGRALLAQVDQRIDEVESLATRRDPLPADIDAALTQAAGDLAQAQRLLLTWSTGYPSAGRRDVTALQSLADATDRSTRRLQALRPQVPAATLPRVDELLTMLGDGRTALLQQARRCGTACAGLLSVLVEGTERGRATVPVDRTAPVGEAVRVDGTARVGGTVRVDGTARVGGTVRVDGTARVGGSTNLTGSQPTVPTGSEPGAAMPAPTTAPAVLPLPTIAGTRTPGGQPVPTPAPTSASVPSVTSPASMPAPLPVPVPVPSVTGVPTVSVPAPIPVPVPTVTAVPTVPTVTAVPTVTVPALLPLVSAGADPGCVVGLGGSCAP